LALPGAPRGGGRRLARGPRGPPALPPEPRLLADRPRSRGRRRGAGRRRAMAPLTLAHPEALAPAAQEIAARLANRPFAEDFYLAGSAALALYLGHRPVRDLDLMTGTNRLTG